MSTEFGQCGGSKGFSFVKLKNRLKKLPGVNPEKLDSLYHDIEADLCTKHDSAFLKGGGLVDFWRANYIFSEGLLQKLQWSTSMGRLLVFIVVFIPLNLFGLRYFHFTKVI